jgi:hypothetical protein
MILLLALAGCSASEPCFDAAPYRLADAEGSLLFDDRPGPFAAGDIAYKGDWPSALSQYQRTEHLHYSESINDVQGRWPFSPDFTYRRFRLEREGYATR